MDPSACRRHSLTCRHRLQATASPTRCAAWWPSCSALTRASASSTCEGAGPQPGPCCSGGCRRAFRSNRGQPPSILIPTVLGAGHAIPRGAREFLGRRDHRDPEKVGLRRLQQAGVYGGGPDRGIAAIDVGPPQLAFGHAGDADVVGGPDSLAQALHVGRRVGRDEVLFAQLAKLPPRQFAAPIEIRDKLLDDFHGVSSRCIVITRPYGG